ncbi:ABC transporter permease [Promicromonospora panici]|uniref:ABC transporter permease n=1 Tax=Promicromonospora panici TaxID=2219658 RepID=UPI00101C0004|nr:ABC transporter permease subunit [Promicromonospora panici]
MSRRWQRSGKRIGPALAGAAGVLALAAAWEAYKALVPDDGWVLGEVRVLPRTSDVAMPHLWDMAARAAEPLTSAPDSPPLWLATLQGAGFTLGVSAVGWVTGVVFGLLVAVLMARFVPARAGLLPWVVLSQTVPLIAIAPLVKRWGAQLEIGTFDWQDWMSVAVIASYLAFFPVSVGALRGFTSPDAAADGVRLDLFRAYGVGWWTTFWRLRAPSSVPYLLPALRLAAANAVVGTVVAEVSTGLRGGLGRMIVEFGASASADPAKQWSPIAGAVLVGLAATGLVALVALGLRRYRVEETA